MYGTVARARLKDGVDEAEVERVFSSFDRPEGSVGVFALRSKDDPRMLWIAGAFESEDVYYQTASSSAQSERFAKLRELMDGDPEWHDGHVLQFVKY